MFTDVLSAWDEVNELLTSMPSPQQILAFHPSKPIELRVRHLMNNLHTRLLSADERAELNEYLEIDTFIRRLKVKALAKVSN